MKNKLSKQDKERLNNRVVFFSSVTILYALLLLFIQRMSADPMTVNGALAFIEILRWVALVGAMCCAAWSAYKEKKSFFLYCTACIFIFLSTTVLRYCTAWGSYKPYYINYIALGAVFVLSQIYYSLKLTNKFQNKAVKNIFFGACGVIFAIFAAVCLVLSFPRF